MPTNPDPATLERLERELATCAPLGLTLKPESALALAGVLQLALRHPGLQGYPLGVAAGLVTEIRAYFGAEACHTAVTILAAGDDPAQDVPTGRRRE